MEKHLLLTVGDDPSAFYAVRFACNFFRSAPELKFTLFYVTPKSVAVYMDDRDYVQGKQDLDKVIERNRAKGVETLAKAREMVLSYGFTEEQLAVKVQPNFFGTVEDIVAEAENGLYDAVVLGRRGLSRFEELMFGSVTRNLLCKEITFPIWVCKRPIVGYKDVLLCIDGSEGSYAVADHVGFILSQLPGHGLTLLYAWSGRDPSGCPGEAYLEEAKKILQGHDIDPSLVQTRIVTGSSNPAETIFKVAEQGKYAAVAVGRTGRKPVAISERKFMGSTTQSLLRKLESTSLWVS